MHDHSSWTTLPYPLSRSLLLARSPKPKPLPKPFFLPFWVPPSPNWSAHLTSARFFADLTVTLTFRSSGRLPSSEEDGRISVSAMSKCFFSSTRGRTRSGSLSSVFGLSAPTSPDGAPAVACSVESFGAVDAESSEKPNVSDGGSPSGVAGGTCARGSERSRDADGRVTNSGLSMAESSMIKLVLRPDDGVGSGTTVLGPPRAAVTSS